MTVTAADVSDLASLPRRFELHAEDVRTRFDLLDAKLSVLTKIHDMLIDQSARISHLERRADHHEKRLTALEARNPRKART